MKKIAPIHWLFLLSHSVQNAWIEIKAVNLNFKAIPSHSVQNAWIEIPGSTPFGIGVGVAFFAKPVN